MANKYLSKMDTKQGFTLIELMITIAIIGIIASIAYPSYNSYLLKSRRIEAQTTLQNIINTAQQYYSQNNNSYPTDLASLYTYYNMDAPDSTNYTFALAACTAPNCVQATATVKEGSSQEKDEDCQIFGLDTNGNQTPAPTGSVNCWIR